MIKKYMHALLLFSVLQTPNIGNAEPLQLSIVPARPIVIVVDADPGTGTVLEGPWFQGSLSITNPTAEVVTIEALAVTLKLTFSGLQSRYIEFEPPIEIKPQETFTHQLYISQLNKGWGYDYKTTIQAVGWIGSKDQRGPRFDESKLTFVTQ